MAIRILSFDVDGCLFNHAYRGSTDRDVVSHNRLFLEEIRNKNNDFSKTITMVGSLRQSKHLDDLGSEYNSTTCCFPAVKEIADDLASTFDPLLLADIFGDLRNGTSCHRILNNLMDHAFCIADESKLLILYAQMHHVAMTHQNEDIVFDFYDDRGNGSQAPEDILEHLSAFFTLNPSMIPRRVTLRLNHYEGNEATPFQPIIGIGSLDAAYRQTIVDMVEITPKHNGHDGCRMCTHHVTPQLLSDFRALSEDPSLRESACGGVLNEEMACLEPTKKSIKLEEEINRMARLNDPYRNIKKTMPSPSSVTRMALITREASVLEDGVPVRRHRGDIRRRASFFGTMNPTDQAHLLSVSTVTPGVSLSLMRSGAT